MKRCPACQRVYTDESLNFCRSDGTPLAVEATAALDTGALKRKLPPGDESPTVIFGEASAGNSTSSPLTRSLTRRRRAARSRAIDSLAVLPLSNETRDAQADYLSDGITESIINTLSRLPKLRVVPRATVFRYKGHGGEDPLAVGRELDVRAVLTGRMLRVGDLLVISAELVDVWAESQIWGEQYRQHSEDVFVIQERIAREISERLRLRITGEE